MLKKVDDLIIVFFVSILALIIPLFLIPVEKILPYPHVIEELVKAILIIFILELPSKNFQLKIAVLFGFFLSTSENIFYLTNFITNNLMAFFWQRTFTTTVFHILTMIIILLPSQKKKVLIIPATLLAIFIHFLYNKVILMVF